MNLKNYRDVCYSRKRSQACHVDFIYNFNMANIPYYWLLLSVYLMPLWAHVLILSVLGKMLASILLFYFAFFDIVKKNNQFSIDNILLLQKWKYCDMLDTQRGFIYWLIHFYYKFYFYVTYETSNCSPASENFQGYCTEVCERTKLRLQKISRCLENKRPLLRNQAGPTTFACSFNNMFLIMDLLNHEHFSCRMKNEKVF